MCIVENIFMPNIHDKPCSINVNNDVPIILSTQNKPDELLKMEELAKNKNLHLHFTHFLRGNFNRREFSYKVMELLRNGKSPEIVFCGCSDGSEVFEMTMAMMKYFKEHNIPYSKIPKMKAFDISPEMINWAKEHTFNIPDIYAQTLLKEYGDLGVITPDLAVKETNIIGYDKDIIARKIDSRTNRSYSIRFPEVVSEKITFYQGSMLTEFRKLDTKNPNIVFCRAVARYNSRIKQFIAGKLLNRLSSGSMVIWGDMDVKIPRTKLQKGLKAQPIVKSFIGEHNFIPLSFVADNMTVYQRVTPNFFEKSSKIFNKNIFLKALKFVR